MVIVLTIPVVSLAQPPSTITGECDCDSLAGQTTCTYMVLSGRPALSHLIFPIPANCVNRFVVSSGFFSFESPRTYSDQFCGEIFGMKADQGMAEGQMETFVITYDGVCNTGVDVVFTALKGGPNCELISVPAVIDCPFVPCVKWSLDGAEFDFRVKKPGTYAGRLATMTVESNSPVNVSFESFDNLVALAPGTGTVAAWYATTPAEQTHPPPEFLAPASFNQQVMIIPGDEVEHRFSLWSKVVIEAGTSACDYSDDATIQLVLENHVTWIDGPD